MDDSTSFDNAGDKNASGCEANLISVLKYLSTAHRSIQCLIYRCVLCSVLIKNIAVLPLHGDAKSILHRHR